MKSIEFIGAPGAGKSYYKKKLENFLLKKKLITYSHSEIFYKYFCLSKKLNFLRYLKFKIKENLINSDSFLINFLNFHYDKIFKFDEDIEEINNYKTNKLFIKSYFKNLKTDNDLQTLKLKKWLNIETAAIHLSKKIYEKKKILINSEGILQRLIRVILNCNNFTSKKLLKKICYNEFESDIIVFVNTSPQISKNRIKKRSENRFKKEEIEKFYNKSKLIYNFSRKKKFTINKNLNQNKIFQKIYENLTH